MPGQNELLKKYQDLKKQYDELAERERERERQKQADEAVEQERQKARQDAAKVVEYEEKEESVRKDVYNEEFTKAVDQLRAQREQVKKMMGDVPVTPHIWVPQEKTAAREMMNLLQGRTKRLHFEAEGQKAIGGEAISLGDAPWNPVGAAAEVLRKAEEQGGAWNSLRRVTMTQNPFKVPTLIDNVAANIDGATNDGKYLAGKGLTPDTTDIADSVTLDARLITAPYRYDRVLAEDSNASVAQEVLYAVQQGIVKRRESFILQGDANISDRANGLLASAGTTVSGVKTYDDFRGAVAALGPFSVNPSDLVLIVGIDAYNHVIHTWEEAKNKDYLSNNSVQSGVINNIAGIDVAISTGVPAATGTGPYTQSALLAHRRAAVLGDRRSVTIETETQIGRDAILVVGSTRMDFQVAHPGGLVEVQFEWGEAPAA